MRCSGWLVDTLTVDGRGAMCNSGNVLPGELLLTSDFGRLGGLPPLPVPDAPPFSPIDGPHPAPRCGMAEGVAAFPARPGKEKN